MTIQLLQCLIPQKNGVLITTDEYEERSGRKLKAVAAHHDFLLADSFRREQSSAFRWSQETQSHSGKQGLLEKDDFNLTISSEVDDHKSGAIVRLT